MLGDPLKACSLGGQEARSPASHGLITKTSSQQAQDSPSPLSLGKCLRLLSGQQGGAHPPALSSSP